MIAPERSARFDIDNLLRDRTVGRHEVIGGLHHDDLLLCRIDAKVGEELEAGCLRALGDENDIDAADPRAAAAAIQAIIAGIFPK